MRLGILRACTVFLLVSAGGLAAADGAFGQDGRRSMSKSMRTAISYYEQGDDLNAMDHFMQVLVGGNPLERPLANKYLNLISERMAHGGGAGKTPVGGVTEVENVQEEEPALGSREVVEIEETSPSKGEEPPEPQGPVLNREKPVERSQGRVSKSDRSLMKSEIEGKIKNRTRVLLGKLQKYQDINVQMANSRLPRAVGIPTGLVFGSGTQFKRDSADVLEILTHLSYSLGATEVVILPENAVLGDSKILDLRRTMAISSHFIKEGLAPSRIKVNLLSSQVDVPRGLEDFRGIMLLFRYNQPLDLTADGGIGTESGPPISLGVSPAALDPEKEEGAIIEFSVQEPQAGLLSWVFELRGPGEKKGDDMVVLQQVKGNAPVFHQIYWNGRSGYFGKVLPGGRYECVLSATDSRNRSRKRHLWITLEGEGPKAPAEAAPEKPAEVAARTEQPPPASLDSEEKAESRPEARRGRTIRAPSQASIRRREARRRAIREKRRAAKTETAKVQGTTIGAAREEAPSRPDSAPAASESAESAPRPRAGAVNYQVAFAKNAAKITPDGENILSRVADTMHYYPLDNINLVGYAYSGERDSASLASQRADAVSRHLVQKHGMKRDRIQVQTKVMDRESHKVEIYIVSGER